MDPMGGVEAEPAPETSGPDARNGRPDRPVLVLGVGNVLVGDDGVGVHVVRGLQERAELPPDTLVVDGGTAGLTLLSLVVDARALILVDAVELGAAPGTVRVLVGDELNQADLVHMSVHQVGLADLVGAARLVGGLPGETVLVGIQPAVLESGVDLSPAVAAALPEATDTVLQWCRRLAEAA